MVDFGSAISSVSWNKTTKALTIACDNAGDEIYTVSKVGLRLHGGAEWIYADTITAWTGDTATGVYTTAPANGLYDALIITSDNNSVVMLAAILISKNLSVAELIAADLVFALSAKTITYNGTTHTLTTERQRSRLNIGNRYPFVEVAGPWINAQVQAHDCNDCELLFSVAMYEDTINDDSGQTIAEAIGDSSAELIKLIMADRTRGGNALNTEWNSCGYAFTGDPENPGFVVYIDVAVKAWIQASNPFNIGA